MALVVQAGGLAELEQRTLVPYSRCNHAPPQKILSLWVRGLPKEKEPKGYPLSAGGRPHVWGSHGHSRFVGLFIPFSKANCALRQRPACGTVRV